MLKKISAAIVNDVQKKGIIDEDSVEEHIYGVNNFLTTLTNIITALVIGVVFNKLTEIVLFIIVYKSLRKYCGGSHADTAWRCYISSCVIDIVVLLAIKYYPFPDFTTIIIVVCSSVIMFLLSPVEAIKKPLDDIERKVFEFRSRILILISLCLFFALYYIPSEYTYHFSLVVAVSIVTVTISLIEGKFQLYINKRKKTVSLL